MIKLAAAIGLSTLAAAAPLAALPDGSDEAKFLTVRMMRARNRVEAALAQANAALASLRETA